MSKGGHGVAGAVGGLLLGAAGLVGSYAVTKLFGQPLEKSLDDGDDLAGDSQSREDEVAVETVVSLFELRSERRSKDDLVAESEGVGNVKGNTSSSKGLINATEDGRAKGDDQAKQDSPQPNDDDNQKGSDDDKERKRSDDDGESNKSDDESSSTDEEVAEQVTADEIKIGALNANSVKNKGGDISELIKGLDILAITETKLYADDDKNKKFIDELVPDGYSFEHIARSNNKGRGGGVGLVFRNNYECEVISQHNVTSFEVIDCLITCKNTGLSFRLPVIYRPPNKSTKLFLQEFGEYLANISQSIDTILLGDYNIHVDNKQKAVVRKFVLLIESFNYKQLVDEPTHKKGRTLDLVLAQEDTALLGRMRELTVYDPHISDHRMITFKIKTTSDAFEKHNMRNNEINAQSDNKGPRDQTNDNKVSAKPGDDGEKPETEDKVKRVKTSFDKKNTN